MAAFPAIAARGEFSVRRTAEGRGELLEEWRQRMVQAERRGQLLQEEHAQLGGRLDRLMEMLEHLTKEPEAH